MDAHDYQTRFLKLLEGMDNDDVILMRCDGGEYWGHYLDVPTIKVVEITNGMADNHFVGHPGSQHLEKEDKSLTSGRKAMIFEA